MEIPIGPESMTPEWLTQALRQNGTISGRVLSFQAQAMDADGEGITGQVVRVQPTYDLSEPTAPHSIIAKFHAADLQTRNSINSLGMYANEFRFYQHNDRQIGLPVPRCYYGDFHESGLTVLLLEDLAPARCTSRDLNSSQVEIAIRQIAKFHANWWENSQLATIIGEEDPVTNQKIWAYLQKQAPERWNTFLELTRDILPQPMIEIGHRIVNNWSVLGGQLRYDSPRTFIHGDFQGDNFFYATAEGGVPFSIIDWQLSGPGKGPYDIGLLMSGISTELRRKSEIDLLKMYHQILVENGVVGYSFEQCMDDYRLTMLECFARGVYAIRKPYPGEDLNRYNEIDHKLRVVTLPRRCAAILDLEADKLLK